MDIVTYALSKKYTQKSLDGLGALKGANCVIESIDTVPEGNRVTFSWTGTDGTIETSTMIVENGIDGNDGTNGADGVGVSKIEKINTVGLIDTYRITFTNNTTYDYSVTNGQKGEQGIQGIRGEKGEQGEQGVQGIQGIKGEKGDDGYPFLIYKEYSDISEFNKNDFPEIGLMFMIVADGASSFPVYRYTGDESTLYSYVTNLTGGEGIKGEKGDKGEQGQQGVQGENGKDGITYIPTIGTVTSGDIASATVIVDDKTSTAEFSFVLPKGDNITVDTILSNTSENPVQNKVVKQAIDNKADKTVATTSADGLMSASDKGKLDAFEITTTGGKLHDKDIATTDLIPTTLPANGGNAKTVNGFTVGCNVPADAVFTPPDLSGYASKALYGDTTINVGRKAGSTVGEKSTAEGENTIASGYFSHAEGIGTTASGNDSHAEGGGTIASDSDSHAEGYNTIASGHASHAEGLSTVASGYYSHAEGENTIANNAAEHASGKYNVSNEDTLFSVGDGTAADARHNAFEITKTGGRLHDRDIGLSYTQAETTALRIEIPDGVDAAQWLTQNAKSGMQYLISTRGSRTGLPNVSADWMWFSYDGNRYFARAWTGATHTTDFVLDAVNSVGGWKEISYTPIKSTTISASTDGNGFFILWSHTENKIPVAFRSLSFPDMIFIPMSSTSNWTARCVHSDFSALSSITIGNVQVFYIEI